MIQEGSFRCSKYLLIKKKAKLHNKFYYNKIVEPWMVIITCFTQQSILNYRQWTMFCALDHWHITPIINSVSIYSEVSFDAQKYNYGIITA